MLERRADPIGLVEAGYEDLPDEDWARNLLDAALCLVPTRIPAVALGGPGGAGAGVYTVDAARLGMDATAAATPLASSLPADFVLPSLSAGKVGTLSELRGTLNELRGTQAEAQAIPAMAPREPDAFYCTAIDAEGKGLFVAALLANPLRLERSAKARWMLLGAHLATAARLRRRRGVPPVDECVLSVAGRIEHAEGEAKDVRVCERLRAAAFARDKARTRAARADAAEALSLWRPLVGGRWSLVDRFDRGGRRCVVARRNDPVPVAPCALSPRERQVYAHLAQGDAMKLASYALGIDASTVSVIVRSIACKLGAQGEAVQEPARSARAAMHDPVRAPLGR
jgi:DNA-binding CsgD family transcriptional regulator